MDQKEIQNLIRFISKSGVAEVSYKTDEYELKVKNILSAQPQQFIQSPLTPQITVTSPQSNIVHEVVASNSVEEKASHSEGKFVTIKSPMIGTFYKKPSPDKPVFVNVGDEIAKGDVVCVIEAMKLFNEIESDISGKIVKILLEDSTPVEFDQPLFLIDPS